MCFVSASSIAHIVRKMAGITKVYIGNLDARVTERELEDGTFSSLHLRDLVSGFCFAVGLKIHCHR